MLQTLIAVGTSIRPSPSWPSLYLPLTMVVVCYAREPLGLESTTFSLSAAFLRFAHTLEFHYIERHYLS